MYLSGSLCVCLCVCVFLCLCVWYNCVSDVITLHIKGELNGKFAPDFYASSGKTFKIRSEQKNASNDIYF